MSGLQFVLDTNVVIYLQSGRLAEPLPPACYGLSVITEMELLSFSRLDHEQERWLHRFIASMTLIELDREVRSCAIALRRTARLKLPDAIVAASAMTRDAILISNDEQLTHIADLRVQSVRLREAGYE